jgi:hypothetical protein
LFFFVVIKICKLLLSVVVVKWIIRLLEINPDCRTLVFSGFRSWDAGLCIATTKELVKLSFFQWVQLDVMLLFIVSRGWIGCNASHSIYFDVLSWTLREAILTIQLFVVIDDEVGLIHGYVFSHGIRL